MCPPVIIKAGSRRLYRLASHATLLYINGVLQLEAEDDAFGKGKIGLETCNATVEFDNIRAAEL